MKRNIESQRQAAKAVKTAADERRSNEISSIRRSQLTKAAYKVVSRKGYYNFTIKDIAKESGLSSGLVHYYFKDKQDLLLNLLKEINANIKSYLHMQLEKSGDPVEKLTAYIDQAFGLVEKEPDYFHVLIDFWTQVNRNQRMRQANIRLFQSYRDECAMILKEGVENGFFNDIDINYTATIIVSLVQGTIIQYVIDNTAFDYRRYVDMVKSQIFSMILKAREKS